MVSRMDEDFSEVEVYSSEVPIIRRFNYDIVYINSIQHSYFKAQKVRIIEHSLSL